MDVIARKSPAIRQRQAGQAMVEFMLVIVVVLIVFLSMVQMILLMHAYNTLADAAKEGVRYAIVHGTGFGGGCSGPGSVNLTPSVSCSSDATGSTYVVPVVTHFAAVSFQAISSTNNGCSTPSGNSVNVCWDPGSANTNNPNFGAACSQPGCLVRVTVSYTYTPLFNLSWPNFTLNAAADGIVAN